MIHRSLNIFNIFETMKSKLKRLSEVMEPGRLEWMAIWSEFDGFLEDLD
jgi:hypothetical protein